MVDPFILLHHYGPYKISARDNPFDLGPHPHRGFEPITILFQGEQLHRDSLGNESTVKAGDVQWTTAGRGIIHSERPTDDLVSKGGVIEGVQLWLNLPSNKKMIPAQYQHVRHEEFETKDFDNGRAVVKVIAGELADKTGKIKTQSPVNVFTIAMKPGSQMLLPLNPDHQNLLYLLKGKVLVNNVEELELDHQQLMQFEPQGKGIHLKAENDSQFLFLSGQPFNEKVTSWGPYVMNTQTEIIEAMRDYQMGKMGFLAP
jgi:hypothetical protein